MNQAILSSPEKRLTLNQIYDWLISSVMYFSERQDNLASSGWKVSLSSHVSEIVDLTFSISRTQFVITSPCTRGSSRFLTRTQASPRGGQSALTRPSRR